MMKNTLYIVLAAFLCTAYACTKPAEACFTYSPMTINTNTLVTFDASCSQNAGGYVWYFGEDEAEVVTSEPVITHTFSTSGPKGITLGIKRNDNKKAGKDKLVIQRTITVQ